MSEDDRGGDWLRRLNASIDGSVARGQSAGQAEAKRRGQEHQQREQAVALIRSEILPAIDDVRQAIEGKGLHVAVIDHAKVDSSEPSVRVQMEVPGKPQLEIIILARATANDFTVEARRVFADSGGYPIEFPGSRDMVTRDNVRMALVEEYERNALGVWPG